VPAASTAAVHAGHTVVGYDVDERKVRDVLADPSQLVFQFLTRWATASTHGTAGWPRRASRIGVGMLAQSLRMSVQSAISCSATGAGGSNRCRQVR
jgi:hypothetical protein